MLGRVTPARRALLLALVSLALVACATRVLAPPPAWQSALGREHPLTGRIWDAGAREFIDEHALIDRLARARFVLLGEKHDNADHHRLQAWVIQGLVAAGRRPAVALEMLSVAETAAVERYRAVAPGDAAGLGAALEWERSGWPPWPFYQPIAEAAISARLPLVGANLTRAATTAVGRRGLDALDPGLIVRTGLDAPLDPLVRASLAEEIREAHCGHAPGSMLERMVAVQRARDAQMADALAAAATRSGAVLIAGAGHVRTDRGVPAYLAVVAPGDRVAAVGFVEVRDGVSEPAEYLDRPVDALWFTPRVDDADPCEQFRRPLERLRERPRQGARP
jgi:uncharacterized iron-regulated protein